MYGELCFMTAIDYCTKAQITCTVSNRLASFLVAAVAELNAVTVQVVRLSLKDADTDMLSVVAVLPVGTLVLAPPPMAVFPAGQVAMAVPLDCWRRVTGVLAKRCTPESPGEPCGPCGPLSPDGPDGPVAPCGPGTPVDPLGPSAP